MQQLQLSPGFSLALLAICALALGFFWYMRESRRNRPLRGAHSRAGRRRDSALREHGAEQLHGQLGHLLKSNAGWNDILASVNPSNSPMVAADLQAIRGPHMFAPALAIQVLQEGCRLALAKNPNASVAEAVQFARRSMEQVTKYGD